MVRNENTGKQAKGQKYVEKKSTEKMYKENAMNK